MSTAALEVRPRRRWPLVVWTVVVLAVGGGLLLLLVLPTRTWLDQRAEIQDREERLTVLEDANADLEQRVAALQTPEEIARVAREEYRLALPGEVVYSVLPSALPEALPAGWPFDLVGQIVAVRSAPPPPPTTAAPAP